MYKSPEKDFIIAPWDADVATLQAGLPSPPLSSPKYSLDHPVRRYIDDEAEEDTSM